MLLIMRTLLKSKWTIILLVILPQIIIATAIYERAKEDRHLEKLRVEYSRKHIPSVDHAKFEVLHRDFPDPRELTKTCLSCHTERGKELMQTAHWKWEREEYIPGRGVVYIGKKNLLNNFCTGIGGSEGTCNRCHIGYGYGNKNFDFADESRIDCMACHDNSGLYKKAKGGAGYPELGLDYRKITASIGLPKKENCGECHFHSAGGNNVKHGTLDMALLNTTKDVDVHMAKDGLDMQCIDCHPATNHQMLGKYYGTSSMNKDRSTCERCHGDFPHKKDVINGHTVKVSCQACHIPIYSKVNSTKMTWDWSTASKLDAEGRPYEIDDDEGNHEFMSIKGSFTWGKNLVPEYRWFNGTADHYLLNDSITEVPVQINRLFGQYNDPESKIWPVKIHRGKQPYDKIHKRLVQAKLWDPEKGKGALWIDFKWNEAIIAGMEYMGLPYSGEYDFVETEMYLPLTHMVSPISQSLSCKECHTRNNSRLAGLNDFYMPGRDRHAGLDYAGSLLIILTLAGIFFHALGRAFFHYRKKTH